LGAAVYFFSRPSQHITFTLNYQELNLYMEKKLIRKIITEYKQNMPKQEIEKISEQLAKAFFALPEYHSANILYAYNSFNQEVRTAQIIEKALSDGKMVAVPRIEGDDLEFRYIKSVEECAQGQHGIMEPHDMHEIAVNDNKKVLMLVPGLAFDRTGARVGYGKGYYDKYLDRHRNVDFVKVALCYDFQLVGNICTDRYDKPVDKIISAPSGRIIICKNRL